MVKMRIIIQGIAGIVVILGIIVMAVVVVYKAFFNEPECSTTYAVVDPNLVLLVFLVDLDEQGVLSEVDKYQVVQGNAGSSWLYNEGELTFHAMLNNRQFSAEVCFTTVLDEDGVPENSMEFRNLAELTEASNVEP
jgi:hypothetical protein